MTKFRAFNSALISVALLLSWGSAANAQQINDITGTNSAEDMACLVFISAIFIGNQDCTYNEVHPFIASITWSGPIFSAGYYPVGGSPFDVGSTPQCDNSPIPPVLIDCPQPADGKADFPIGGTVTIDDQGTPCTADDTIAAAIALGAATRAATGGGDGRIEETWGDGGVVFNIDPTTVSTATPNGGGCDYVIASQGMPPLLQQGGVDDYPADDTGNGSPGFCDASAPVAMASWNPGPQFGPIDTTNCVAPGGATPPGCDGTGNIGAVINVTVDGSWSCTELGTTSPACDPGAGSQFTGSRAILENALISVSIDGNGDITAARMFANNEDKTLDSAPLYSNVWDGAVLDFTGTCNNCAGGAPVAGDDGPYSILEGSADAPLGPPTTGTNDTGWTNNVTITVTVPPTLGTATPIGSGGPAMDTNFNYLPNLAATGPDTFTYQVDDGVTQETAVVSIDIQADIPPVANPGTGPDIDTQGVAPDSTSGDLNVTSIQPPIDMGNTPSTVTAVAAGASDAGTCAANGTTVTFTPDAATFVGTGVCDYTIEDAQMETATSTVTFDIPNALPAISDTSAGESPSDQPVTVDLSGSITLGNGDAAQNPLTVTTDATDGSCTLTGTDLTYTPDAGFEGPDACTVTITDGNGDTDEGIIDLIIAAGQSTEGLPGGSSATDLWTLSMLLGLPLLRRRRRS